MGGGENPRGLARRDAEIKCGARRSRRRLQSTAGYIGGGSSTQLRERDMSLKADIRRAIRLK
jgi:hypothetical protein